MDTTLSHAARRPGRFVWFSRIPFVIFATVGAMAIVGLKVLGFDQLWVTVIACALIVIYAVVVLSVPILRIREDQLGDNSYYLGFLYTLVSLCWALYEFGRAGGVEDIVSNFGIALGSTIVGIAMRVFLNQARRDVLEIERDARIELVQAVVRLRGEIDDAVLALSSFCRTTQQTATEHINASAEHAAQALDQSIAKFGVTCEAVIGHIDETLTEFHNHTTKINQHTGKTVKAIESLVERINGIEVPPDLITRRLDPLLAAADSVAMQISEKLRQDEASLEVFADHLRDLQTELRGAIEVAHAASLGVSEAAESTKAITSSGQHTATAFQALTDVAESALASQTRIAIALDETSARVLASLKVYNAGIETELERSRRNIGLTSEALGGLAAKITRDLT